MSENNPSNVVESPSAEPVVAPSQQTSK